MDMVEQGARYQRACQASAEILNQHVSPDKTKPAQFAEIVFCLMRMMQAVEDDLGKNPWRPSEN
jgi:hypothetical protein